MFLFMLSSGLTLIFGMMGILNFAHASFFMIGAYLGYQISYFTNFWIALMLAPVLVGYFGVIVEKYGLIPKSCYQESFHSGRSSEMNNILQKKF